MRDDGQHPGRGDGVEGEVAGEIEEGGHCFEGMWVWGNRYGWFCFGREGVDEIGEVVLYTVSQLVSVVMVS